MNEESSNYLGFGLFFFLIVLIVLFGSILLFWNVQSKRNEKKINSNSEVIVSDKNKQDKTKDFIYFTEEETISEELNIIHKIPIVNLNSEDANNVNKEMREYANSIKTTLQKVNEEENVCSEESDGNIYQTKFLDYAIYTYQEFITLVVRESFYSCASGISTSSYVKSYTFNVLTGKKLDFKSLLSKYNTTMTRVLEQMQNSLDEAQSIIEEVPNIAIEETINSLKEQETYILYIDEFGDLVINYVVKTNSVDYNDTITINRK